MGYPMDIDDVGIKALENEISRRKKHVQKGDCPYCGRVFADHAESPCKHWPHMLDYVGVDLAKQSAPTAPAMTREQAIDVAASEGYEEWYHCRFADADQTMRAGWRNVAERQLLAVGAIQPLPKPAPVEPSRAELVEKFWNGLSLDDREQMTKAWRMGVAAAKLIGPDEPAPVEAVKTDCEAQRRITGCANNPANHRTPHK